MLVFWKEKLVLLAVPKTGTTALAGALAPYASLVLRDPPHLKHSPVYRYQRFLAPFFEKAGGQEMETMAIVRHPVDWLSSWYRYRHRDALDGHPNSTKGISFDDFVGEYCRGKPAAYAAVGSQATFVQGPQGALGVDYLFQYEAFATATRFLQDRLGRSIETRRLNVSPDHATNLSGPMLAKLERKRSIEFDVWTRASGPA